MPPQIKHDLNRSGWETTDFPSVCESCLPENPFVRILKEDHGAECKLCTRPFTIFSWATDRAHGRKKRTNICLTCARLKNACQCCIMDLQFGLPIMIRDRALQMMAPGPQSDVNREYFAQNNEKLIEEGKAGLEVYEKPDEKARDLLRKLAQSKPYFRKGREYSEDGTPSKSGSSAHGGSNQGGDAVVGVRAGGPGPIRTRDLRATGAVGGARPRAQGLLPSASQAPGPSDWLPPVNPKIMSLFVTGIEDDLPEYKIRDHFRAFGTIKSLVVSHMSHCAFVNYESRAAAEAAAAACKGRLVLAGCPLRVRWSQPRAVGLMKRDERVDMLRDGRSAFPKGQTAQSRVACEAGEGGGGEDAPPPTVATALGSADIWYPSMAGE